MGVCLGAIGCGSGSPEKGTTVDLALHRQKVKRRELERELARMKRKVHREEKAQAERAATRAPQTGGGTLLAPGAAESFEALSASIPAQLGVALAPLGGSGEVEVFGSLRSGHAWSTIKVPILVTLMREGALSSGEQQWAAAALEASDNEAAARLFDQLEKAHGGLAGASAAVQEVLAASGDTGTTVATDPPPPGAFSTYGQTEWSLEGTAVFIGALARGCLLSPVATDYVLDLMREVIPEQRWGLGQAGFEPGWAVAMKGGWGPEAGSGAYLVRQAGVVQDGSAGVVVAMIVAADSLAAGTADLTKIAAWLRENLIDLGSPAQGC